MDWAKLLTQVAMQVPALVPTLLRSLADYLEQHPEALTKLIASFQPKS